MPLALACEAAITERRGDRAISSITSKRGTLPPPALLVLVDTENEDDDNEDEEDDAEADADGDSGPLDDDECSVLECDECDDDDAGMEALSRCPMVDTMRGGGGITRAGGGPAAASASAIFRAPSEPLSHRSPSARALAPVAVAVPLAGAWAPVAVLLPAAVAEDEEGDEDEGPEESRCRGDNMAGIATAVESPPLPPSPSPSLSLPTARCSASSTSVKNVKVADDLPPRPPCFGGFTAAARGDCSAAACCSGSPTLARCDDGDRTANVAAAEAATETRGEGSEVGVASASVMRARMRRLV